MAAALPAFLIEVSFYLFAMFESTRAAFARIRGRRSQAALLWISALIPYAVFALAAGTFTRNGFYLLAMLTAVFAFWHAVLPRRFAYDVGFLAIAAAPVVLRVFQRIYVSPDPHLRVDVLGHLMWIRLGVIALLVLREWQPGPFSLWPQASEWRSGLIWFAVFILPIAGVAIGTHDVQFGLAHGTWIDIVAIAAGTFLGGLWVIALSEELFFRGVIERALLNQWSSPLPAILISALIFGSAHLWFHAFPNWKRACTAAVLGIACGVVYWRSGSVRAPMVTHAMVITTWRVFFNKS